MSSFDLVSKCGTYLLIQSSVLSGELGILAAWLEGNNGVILSLLPPRRNKRSLHAKGGLFRQGKTRIIYMGKTPNVIFRVVLLQCFKVTLNSVKLRCVDQMDVRGGNHSPLIFRVI